MFRIRQTITLSVMFHALLLAAVSIIGGGSELRAKRIIAVSLFEDFGDAGRPAGEAVAVPGRRTLPTRNLQQQSATAKIKVAESPLKRQEQTGPAERKEVVPEKGPGVMIVDVGISSVSTASSSPSSGSARSGAQSSGPAQTGGVMAGSTGAGNQGNSGDADSALRLSIRDALQKNLVYPHLARKRGIEGTVQVEFHISRQGAAEHIKVTRGSGYQILDAAARETVLKASPFPGPGKTVDVPIIFRLRD